MKKLTILIAEDDQVSELLTKVMIEDIGGKVYTAKNGKDAIEICKKHPEIDLVLMDIKMPVIDGYLATSKIREFNKDVVIIAITAYALTGDKEKALEAGCTDYIAKPVTIDQLKNLIMHYFN